MGAWGPGIFENDLASDVRDEWREGIRAGQDPTALTARIRDELGVDGEPGGTEFWTGLAAAQFETGRLDAAVRDRALAVIDGGGDLEDRDGDEGRAAALRTLAEQLRGPQPPVKRLRAHPPGPDPGVSTGDVLRIRSSDGSRAALFHVVDTIEERGEKWPVLLGLYWAPADPHAPIPPDEELAALPYLSTVDLTAFEPGEDLPDLPMTYPHVLAVMVGTPREVFGPSVGEVVARGIARPSPIPQDEIGDLYSSWEVVMGDVDAIDLFLEASRRRIERYGDSPPDEAAFRAGPELLAAIEEYERRSARSVTRTRRASAGRRSRARRAARAPGARPTRRSTSRCSRSGRT